MQIFVVTGSCGEYSDRKEWVVIAYPTEELAQQHVVFATGASKARSAEYQSESDWDLAQAIRNRPNPFDPSDCGGGYDESRYYYTAIDLADALPVVEQDAEPNNDAEDRYNRKGW